MIDIASITSDDIISVIKDSSNYNDEEFDSLLFEEIRLKIMSYLQKILRNIEVIKKHYHNSDKKFILPILEQLNPKKFYFSKKIFRDYLLPLDFSEESIDLIQANIENYISDIVDGGLIIKKNPKVLTPGDIHTYSRIGFSLPKKEISLKEDIKKVVLEIYPDSIIEKGAVNTINILLNELSNRILKIAKKLKTLDNTDIITLDEIKTSIDIVFDTSKLNHSQKLHFHPNKVCVMVCAPIHEDAVIFLTGVLEYICAEIVNQSYDESPMTSHDVIQAIENDDDLQKLFRYTDILNNL